MKKALLFLIHLYKLAVSPYLGSCCRFYPSCSSYACEVIDKHGCMKGCLLALKRIVKCGPWHRGGVDKAP